jgi:RNAse (barnase) inhibitor barstar
MKKLTTMILLFTSVFILSCEGPMGPPGEDGDALIGSIFEMEGDFNASNEYELFFDFPQNFEIYDTDVVLVYLLWDVVNVNGKNTDVWRLMPQTIVFKDIYPNYTETDVLQYNFDYTVNDVRIFLETTMQFSDLLPAETQDQVFRIAVVPADFIASKKAAEISDLNVLMNSSALKFNVIGK